MNTAPTSIRTATVAEQVSIGHDAESVFRSCCLSRRTAASGLSRWCVVIFALSLTGCGYTVGNNFSRDIQSVAVPIFDNKTNRRGLEFQLTEAVQKEITKRSPYRLAKGTQADTRLTGSIVTFRKDVLGETRFDDGRELQISLMVKVQWEDLRSGQVLAQQEIPLSPEAIPMASQAEFSPEVGQSLATALDDANKLMARKIVNLMELPSL